MAKRKKYPRLPNGYGSIKYLGKNRRNPYAVHPPVKEFNEDGIPQTPKALCYVDDWYIGFAVLTAYKAGTYTPGMELSLKHFEADSGSLSALTQKILADYNTSRKAEEETPKGKTFKEVYEEFYKYKFERAGAKKYSDSSKRATKVGFTKCAILHEREFRSLRHDDLQNVIDSCTNRYATLELILSLLHQVYAYADIYDLCDKDYSAHLKINKPDDDEHGVPFSEKDLKILWKHKDNEIVEMLLIMCYSGFRITAYKTLEVHLKEKYFKGGIKTEAGKNRIVPIHSAILPLVKNRMKRCGCLLPTSVQDFRGKMRKTLTALGVENHTPHDCRHTFSKLCEQYELKENDRKRMLGHSFGTDITNQVYGHRELEDLRTEIEKISVCY